MRTLSTVLVLAMAMSSFAALGVAQTAQKPAFEVASIKRNTTGRGTRIDTPPNSRVNITSATLRTLVTTAYRVQDYQIIGGPDWIGVDRFDVQARPTEGYQPERATPCLGPDCPVTAVQMMMQGLLTDRWYRLRSTTWSRWGRRS